MVARAYLKTVWRTLTDNLGRFIAVTSIILLGIAFVSGLGTLSFVVEASLNDRLVEQRVADVIVKASDPAGLGEAEIEKLSGCAGVVAAEAVTAADTAIDGVNARLYVMPLRDRTVNRLTLTEGEWPSSAEEILVERASDKIASHSVGDSIEVMGAPRTVSGIAANPLIFYKDGEPDLLHGEPLELIVYFDAELFPAPMPYTDLYIKTDAAGSVFSKEYKDRVQTIRAEIAAAAPDAAALTLNENVSYRMLEGYGDKIDVLTLVFPVFFIAVAALVVLTTMTRMIEEERAAIGCYKTLGYGDGKVSFKYAGFSLLCCVVGAAAGMAVGLTVLPIAVYPAFHAMFFMPEMAWAVRLSAGLWAAAATVIAVVGVTFYLIMRELKGQPAALLKPKSPKAGKKIFLEKIPFLWKRLSFRYKSTLRNIFRYGKHLAMTVLSVAGSTALVLAGFGLYNVSMADSVLKGFSESMSTISVVVIAFAVLLCVLVIYNLTNMNIGERTREIATLKVLGYHEAEVCGYIFREILIMAALGVLVGLPLGYGLLYFVFAYMDFGAIGDVRWYSFLLSAALVLFVVLMVECLLAPKIRRIDMTASLKSVE